MFVIVHVRFFKYFLNCQLHLLYRTVSYRFRRCNRAHNYCPRKLDSLQH